jgi:hypothetical protein
VRENRKWFASSTLDFRQFGQWVLADMKVVAARSVQWLCKGTFTQMHGIVWGGTDVRLWKT